MMSGDVGVVDITPKAGYVSDSGDTALSGNPIFSSSGRGTGRTTVEALIETISVSPVHAVEKLLEENPDIVHVKVWHGMTLAHKACMRGDEHVLAALLRGGAETDARTDAGETPLHYACRKGRLPLVTLLLRNGADVLAADGAGHGCMHYAAQGASVTVMAYLHEVHQLDYHKQSFALQTALHVAALHGHWPTVMFLLRKQRCDVRQADVMGNTALHLAARGGQINICWQMVAQGGGQCLTASNTNQQTPLDMAMNGTTYRDKETQDWLKKMEQQYTGKRGGLFHRPRLLWTFNLFYPTLIGWLAPETLSLLLPRLQIVLYLAGLFVMARWIVKQDHRVAHPCRWPNPARAGIFLWGILANLFCYFCRIDPLDPKHWLINWLSWTSIFCFALALSGFLFSRSGKYTLEEPSLDFSPRKSDRSIRDWSGVEQATPGASFCDECELIQVLGVRHCRMCGHCYRHLHHHCIFLLRCVTATNACYFQSLLGALAVCCVLYVTNVVAHVQAHAQTSISGGGPEAVWHLLSERFFVAVMVLIDCLGTVWCLILIRYHRSGVSGSDGHAHAHGHSHNV